MQCLFFLRDRQAFWYFIQISAEIRVQWEYTQIHPFFLKARCHRTSLWTRTFIFITKKYNADNKPNKICMYWLLKCLGMFQNTSEKTKSDFQHAKDEYDRKVEM